MAMAAFIGCSSIYITPSKTFLTHFAEYNKYFYRSNNSVDNINISAILYSDCYFKRIREEKWLLDIIILLGRCRDYFFKNCGGILGTRPQNTATPISQESAAKIFDILIKESQKKNAEKEAVDGGKLKARPTNLSETEKVLQQIPGFSSDAFS